MKIRSALGALCGAVALTAGLVVTTGTAVAATPVLSDAAACTAARATVQTDEAAVRAATDPAVRATAIAALQAARAAERTACAGLFPGHGYPGYPGFPGHHGFPGGGLGLGGLNLINGNLLALDDGLQANVCDYPTWQPFYDHWNSHFGTLRDQLNELRYRQLLAQANCGNNLGGLTLINGNLINLGSYGVLGGDNINVCNYPDYRAFNDFGIRRWGGHFNGFGSRFGGFLGGDGWRQLRVRANCSPTVVVVNGGTTVNEPAPVSPPPVPAAAPETAPAPLTGAGNYHYPASAPNTGN